LVGRAQTNPDGHFREKNAKEKRTKIGKSPKNTGSGICNRRNTSKPKIASAKIRERRFQYFIN